MNAFASIPEAPLRPVLHPEIYVEARDKDPRDEDSRQAEYIATSRKVCRTLKAFAVPNAAKRSQWAAAKVKREGLYAGWPDTGACFGWGIVAWIEFKNGTAGPDDNQIDTLNWLHGRGFPVAICRTPQGAFKWLAKIGAPIPAGLA